MADYKNSPLLNAQAKLFGAFQEGTLRYRRPETFMKILESSNSFYMNYDMLRTREDRTLVAYYRKRTSRALSTGRSEAHTGVKGQTGTLTPSWTTYSDPFAMHLKQSGNNLYSLDEMLSNEVENVFKNFSEGLETLGTAFLFNNKSGVNTCTVEGSFNAALDAFEITMDKEKRVGQIIKTVMDINKYSTGALVVICDSIMYNKIEFYANQGGANSENLSFQFGGVTWVHAPELYALASGLGYTDGYAICYSNGMIGCLNHIPKENKAGIVTSVNKYGTIINPIDGLEYAVHEYEARSNGSTTGTDTNGYTQDVLTQREVSIDLSFDDAPLDVAGETVLQAFALVEASV